MSVNPYKLTRISVTGKESQIPGMPRVNARSNAIGIIKIKLRNRERICPYTVNCVEEKVIDVMILKPANGQAMKYRTIP